MKNKFLAILLSSISIMSCTAINNIDKLSKTETKNILINKDPKMVLLDVKYDDTKIQKESFKIKKFLNTNKDFSKVEITTLSNDITQKYSKVSSISSFYQILSPEGKNRIISMNFLDANNKVISSMMSVVDINSLSTNIITLNYFNTILAQIALNVLKGANPNLLSSINFSDVRTYLLNITGYDGSLSNFSKIDPLSINTVKIAEYISTNNGALPPETTPDLAGFGTASLTIDQLGVNVNFTDLSSEANQNTTSNSVSITKITPGIWHVYVSKPGYVAFSQEVKISANQNVNLSVNLVKKTQVPIDGFIGTDGHIVP